MTETQAALILEYLKLILAVLEKIERQIPADL